MIEQEMMNTFILTKTKIKTVEMSVLKLKSQFFYFNSNTVFKYAKKEGKELILIGFPLDIRKKDSSLETVLDTLIIAIENKNLYEELDYIAGRYALIYQVNGIYKILNDATGMLRIFYTDNFKYIVSNPNVLKYLDYGDSSLEKELEEFDIPFYKYGYPGFYTKYKSVNLLPPNFEINYKKKMISRFFPRENTNKDVDKNELIIMINQAMGNQISSLLKQNKKIYCSLTAGMNSRFTLIATQFFPGIEYVTYFVRGNKEHEKDVNWAKIIASIMKLKHQVLDVDNVVKKNKSEYKNFCVAIQNNAHYTAHSYKISYVYNKQFQNTDSVLIRSNLCEVARNFYGERLSKIQSDNWAEIFAYLYDPRIASQGIISNAFQKYADQTIGHIYNYQPIDIFYWEHRMGTWHANLVAETDAACETIVLENARKILSWLLSVSQIEKKENTILNQSIKQYLPELNHVPINKEVKDICDTFSVVAKIDGNKLIVDIHCAELEDDLEFAFYVFLNNKRVAVQMYSKDSHFEYQINTPGKYMARGFIRKKSQKGVANSSNTINFLGKAYDRDLNQNDFVIHEGRNDYSLNNYLLRTQYKKGKNNKLIVLFNGAVGDRKNVQLPIFHRLTWGNDVEDHVLNISDPTLMYDSNLRLGWYLGKPENPLMEVMKEFVSLISNSLNIKLSDVVLYGSSGGGFAALSLAAYIGNNIKAVAINPQIYIEKYYAKSTLTTLRDVWGGNGEQLYLSIEKLWRDKNPEATVLIYQNEYDHHHYKFHFLPFLKSLDTTLNNKTKSIKTIIFQDEKGHVAESKSMFQELIDKVRNRSFNEII